jgi:hypothetical protein
MAIITTHYGVQNVTLIVKQVWNSHDKNLYYHQDYPNLHIQGVEESMLMTAR